MDETIDARRRKALERYALLGGILYRKGERGAVVRQVADLATSELKLSEGATAHLSRATFYRMLAAVRAGGAQALERKERSDKGTIRAIAPETLERLLALRTEHPQVTTPVLIRTLELAGEVAEGKLRPSTVRRILHERAPRAAAGPRRAYRRWEVAGPMALWQGDASPGPWLHGQRLHLYLWLDVFSRTIVAGRYYLNQRLPAFDDCLWRAIARYGVPRGAHVDNGAPYVSRHFLRVLADLGIRPIHATPRQPTGKGRVERVFRTIQDQVEPALRDLVERGEITTLDALNDLLARWIEDYNRRRHSTTKQAPLDLLGETEPYPDLRRLGEIFLWREERKVTRRGEVSLGGNSYAVPDDLVGLRVTVAFHPFDLSEVFIELKDQTITAKPSLPVAHLTLPKLTEPARRRRTAPGAYLQGLPERPGRTSQTPPAFVLSDASLAALLQDALGRDLHVEEMDLVRLTLSRPGLPVPAEAERRLLAFIRRAGRDLHLSRYLVAITKDGDL